MILPPQSFYRRNINLILVAGSNLGRRNLFRTCILIVSLAAILFPFLVAIAISEGIKSQSRISVEEGADFYVAGDAGGSSVPLPLAEMDRFRKIPGVARVVPRIVGRAYIQEQSITIVGIPSGIMSNFPKASSGRNIQSKGEVIVGSSLGRRHRLYPDTHFYLPMNPWKHFKVVGAFAADSTIWGSNLMYMSLDDAGELYRMKGMATDFLIYVEPKQNAAVNVYLQMENKADPPLRIQSRELVHSYLQKGFESRTGIFSAFYIAAFALSIPLIFLLTGLGWRERRKEIGVLKALGWQTLEVMKVIFWENIFVSLSSACVALMVAIAWIRLLNGYFIAQFFIGTPGFMPDFEVPAQFMPVPAFLAFLLAMTLTMSGSLYNTWRLAATPAGETMR